MTLRRILLPLFLFGASSTVLAQEGLVVDCLNPLGVERIDAMVSFPAAALARKNICFRDGATIVPHQVVDGRILLVLSLGPNETKRLTVDESGLPPFPKRTQADLAVKVDCEIVGGVYTGGKFRNVLATVSTWMRETGATSSASARREWCFTRSG
jgi:hypothetical protein